MTRANATGLLLLMLASHASFGQPKAVDRKPVETTLCDVVTHSVRFAAKLVRFHASLLSDGLEHAVLVDHRCELGIIPHIPDEFKSRPDIQAFERAVDSGRPGTLDKRVSATFTGTFVRNGQKRILEVEVIANVKITPAPKVEH
jgi:hypothetical protein